MNISIVIPVYNTEKYLDDCLRSITSEFLPNDEILIIDDGSTDRSSKIYNAYQTAYQNIRVIKKENEGVSKARNVGMTESKKEYILFVDSDDIMMKGWRTKIKKIKNNPDIIYFNKNIAKNCTKEGIIKCLFSADKQVEHLMMPSSKLFSRKFIIKNKIKFNKKIINGEDLLFNIEAILSTNNFACVQDSIYQYRLNDQSITHSYNVKLLGSDVAFHNYLNNIKNKLITREYKDECIKNAIVLLAQKLTIATQDQQKEILNHINGEPYAAIMRKNIKNNTLKQNIYFYLVKHKARKILIHIIKLKTFAKSKNKENFVII